MLFGNLKGGEKLNRLREIRKSKGLSQEKLSALSRVNRVSISKYETGRTRPRIDSLEKICTALGVKVSDVVEQEAS